MIEILSIRIQITFKLEAKAFDFDFSDPRKFFGLMNILKPFISHLASITDAKINFNELVILEGFYSQKKLFENIFNSYRNQGIYQIYKILGSSNIIGNPAGFIDKVGSGFFELVREPYLGLQQGPQAFIQGMGTGVQEVVRGVVGGGFESLSTMTGSMYSVIKLTSGGEDLRRDKAENIAQGVFYAVKGIGIEVYHGIKGIVTKPIEGARRRGG